MGSRKTENTAEDVNARKLLEQEMCERRKLDLKSSPEKLKVLAEPLERWRVEPPLPSPFKLQNKKSETIVVR